MPIESGAIRGRIERQHPCGQGVIFPIEENQLDTGCAPRKNAEIHPSGRYVGAERSASSVRLGILHGWFKSSFAASHAANIEPVEAVRRGASHIGRISRAVYPGRSSTTAIIRLRIGSSC